MQINEKEIAILRKYRKNARRAIKDLLRQNELLRACWDKEISLCARLKEEKKAIDQKYFRFARFAYSRLCPEDIADVYTLYHTKNVYRWLQQWEKEIDRIPVDPEIVK